MAEEQAAEAAVETPAGEAKPPRFTARLQYARISPRKMRYVVDMIRGMDYNNAISVLRSSSRRGAMFCKKLLESAYGNAVHLAQERNLDIDGNKLHLVEARVDPGPVMKRWRPSSQRRPFMIKKRISHVFFALEERELRETRSERARRQKQERSRAASEKKQAEAAKKGGAKEAKDAPAPKAEAKAKGKGKAKGKSETPKKKAKGKSKEDTK